MPDHVFIPVYGVSGEVNKKLTDHSLSDKFTAVPPLQAIIANQGVTMRMDESITGIFDDEVCFLQFSVNDVSEEDANEILTTLKLEVVPISLTSASEEDDDEGNKIIAALEEDHAEEDSEKAVTRLQRYKDSMHRIMSSEPDTYPTIVNRSGKLINRMIRTDAERTIFFVQMPSMMITDGGGFPDIFPDPDSDTMGDFSVFPLDSPHVDGSLDVNGDYFLVTDAYLHVFIESLTPCIVTTMSISSQAEVIISSWIIHEDSIEGATPIAASDLIDYLEENGYFPQPIKKMFARIDYQWSNDIPSDQMSVLSPLVSLDEATEVLRKFVEDEDDE